MNSLQCKSCGVDNDEKSNFCIECGTSIIVETTSIQLKKGEFDIRKEWLEELHGKDIYPHWSMAYNQTQDTIINNLFFSHLDMWRDGSINIEVVMLYIPFSFLGLNMDERTYNRKVSINKLFRRIEKNYPELFSHETPPMFNTQRLIDIIWSYIIPANPIVNLNTNDASVINPPPLITISDDTPSEEIDYDARSIKKSKIYHCKGCGRFTEFYFALTSDLPKGCTSCGWENPKHPDNEKKRISKKERDEIADKRWELYHNLSWEQPDEKRKTLTPKVLEKITTMVINQNLFSTTNDMIEAIEKEVAKQGYVFDADARDSIGQKIWNGTLKYNR